MSHPPLIRVLIADDHPMIRVGLNTVIASSHKMCVIGEASNGFEALHLYRLHRPDVVLMDMYMPHMDGVQATRAICTEFSGAGIIAFSVSDREEVIYQVMKAGARGYLLEEASSTLLLQTIEAVAAGQTILADKAAANLAIRIHLRYLTEREQEILKHVVAGESNGEIAAALFISEGTVKSHMNRILDKLQVTDRTQAAIVAIRRGLVWGQQRDCV